jgi:hypothetical protein
MATEEAKKRLAVIAFWQKHGIEATKDAHAVSRRTLFRWKAMLAKSKGKVEGLNEKSTAPTNGGHAYACPASPTA